MRAHPDVIAVARWEPLAGDPSAGDRGRWVVESPDVGYLGLLDAPRHDEHRVAVLLREMLVADGYTVDFESVSLGDRSITAWAPQRAAQDATLDSRPADPSGTPSPAMLTSGDGTTSTTGTTSASGGASAVTTAGGAGEEGGRVHGVAAATSETTSSGSSGQDQGPEGEGAGALEGVRPVEGAGGAGESRPHPAGELLTAVGLLVGAAGLPAPRGIAQLWARVLPPQLQMDSPGDVDAWAAHHGVTASDDGDVLDASTSRPWVQHVAEVTVAGHPVEIWSPRYVEPPPCGPVSPVPAGSCAGTSMTPARRGLLAEVDNGDVYAERGLAYHRETEAKRTSQIVTALAAGWVVEGRQERPGKRVYQLTDAGREAAAASDRARGGDS